MTIALFIAAVAIITFRLGYLIGQTKILHLWEVSLGVDHKPQVEKVNSNVTSSR